MESLASSSLFTTAGRDRVLWHFALAESLHSFMRLLKDYFDIRCLADDVQTSIMVPETLQERAIYFRPDLDGQLWNYEVLPATMKWGPEMISVLCRNIQSATITMFQSPEVEAAGLPTAVVIVSLVLEVVEDPRMVCLRLNMKRHVASPAATAGDGAEEVKLPEACDACGKAAPNALYHRLHSCHHCVCRACWDKVHSNTAGLDWFACPKCMGPVSAVQDLQEQRVFTWGAVKKPDP